LRCGITELQAASVEPELATRMWSTIGDAEELAGEHATTSEIVETTA
jgi:hypothetical protein